MHVHPPPAADWQLTDWKPTPDKGELTPSQLVVVPEICKHPAGSSTVASPVVVVPSVYVPSALAVHVPVTWTEPEMVGFVQLRGIETRR